MVSIEDFYAMALVSIMLQEMRGKLVKPSELVGSQGRNCILLPNLRMSFTFL